MALNIKDAETDRLARALAAATGESITDATRIALQERLRRLPRRSVEADLQQIIRRGRARATQDPGRSEDDILGYGVDGLPQ